MCHSPALSPPPGSRLLFASSHTVIKRVSVYEGMLFAHYARLDRCAEKVAKPILWIRGGRRNEEEAEYIYYIASVLNTFAPGVRPGIS